MSLASGAGLVCVIGQNKSNSGYRTPPRPANTEMQWDIMFNFRFYIASRMQRWI